MSEPKKAPAKPKRASSRPRIDAICRHILAGSYDDEIPMLLGAIESRQNKRKEAVAELVKQVYGADFDVKPKANPFVERAQARAAATAERQPGEILPGESPHVLDPNSAAADEALERDPDYESRSPTFGSIAIVDPPPEAQ
jgi:hypothetical protein